MFQGEVGVPMPATVGRRTKELRESAGFTQQRLAEVAGLSISTVTKLEAGKVDPNLSTLRAIARALNVTVGELVEEEGEPERAAVEPKTPPKPRRTKRQ